MDSGPFSPMHEWFAETTRSLLAKMEALGVTTAAEVEIDTLANSMRAESLEHRDVSMSPMMVEAFARKPHGDEVGMWSGPKVSPKDGRTWGTGLSGGAGSGCVHRGEAASAKKRAVGVASGVMGRTRS